MSFGKFAIAIAAIMGSSAFAGQAQADPHHGGWHDNGRHNGWYNHEHRRHGWDRDRGYYRGWGYGGRYHRARHCRWTWRHHHRIRVCRADPWW